MSLNFNLRKGFDIKLKGRAVEETGDHIKQSSFAIKPTDFIGITRPKLLRHIGDELKAGTPILFDKLSENVMYCSPVSGEIIDIVRGEKRTLEEIRILPDKNIKYVKHKIIIYGLESNLFQNNTPFKERVKNKILCTGAIGKTNIKSKISNAVLNPKRSGWYFYKLRTLCKELDYVEYSGINEKLSDNKNQDYPVYTSKYRAIIAATTFYPTLKYWENAAAGCLTFMEITEKNNGYFLGYNDNETAIFINEKNYKEKFQQYLNDPDNPKWEQIANAGREYTMNNLTNDHAVSSLVELMKEVT